MNRRQSEIAEPSNRALGEFLAVHFDSRAVNKLAVQREQTRWHDNRIDLAECRE